MTASAQFINPVYETQIQHKGFVYIADFISSEKVDELFRLYKSLHTTYEQAGMWNSLYNLDKESAALVSSKILNLIQPDLNSLLEKYETPVASFMSKNPNELGVCELHRDYSIMDETRFEYRNLWIPLVDITLQNGALFALAGSHKIFNYPLPMFCRWPYTNLQSELQEQVEVFTIKAGSLIVYTDRTLHGSFLNKSNTSRPVVHLGALPVGYQLAYYYLAPDNQVKVFQVPYSFFFENNFGDQTGKYPLLRSFAYAPPVVDTPLLINS